LISQRRPDTGKCPRHTGPYQQEHVTFAGPAERSRIRENSGVFCITGKSHDFGYAG
jgi:hypothetical protein